MSGGSYGYLYMRDGSDVACNGVVRDLREMAEILRRLELDVAASMVEHHADVIEASLTVIEARHDRLADLLHAVEWYADSDWSAEQVVEVAKKLVDGDPKP